MKIKNNDLGRLKPKIVKVLKENKIKKAGIFGSFVRGEQKKSSDIDLLIQPTSDMSLLDFIEIKLKLEDELGRKIDLISYSAIHPLLKKQILKQEIKII
ncbi:MAG: nucleotidyltransferase family protein [archaeon]